jgi:hypothetical protein
MIIIIVLTLLLRGKWDFLLSIFLVVGGSAGGVDCWRRLAMSRTTPFCVTYKPSISTFFHLNAHTLDRRASRADVVVPLLGSEDAAKPLFGKH